MVSKHHFLVCDKTGNENEDFLFAAQWFIENRFWSFRVLFLGIFTRYLKVQVQQNLVQMSRQFVQSVCSTKTIYTKYLSASLMPTLILFRIVLWWMHLYRGKAGGVQMISIANGNALKACHCVLRVLREMWILENW